MSGVMSQPGPKPIPVPASEVYVIAVEYVDAGRFDAADRLLRHILAVSPHYADALHLSGLIAFRRGRWQDAADFMEQGGRAAPMKGVHLRNLAEVYRQLGRLDEAALAAQRGSAMDPADPLGPFNLAMVEYDRLQLDACLMAVRKALALNPALPEAQMKLAQALLVTGALRQGWEPYEWRYKIPGAAPLMPPTERLQWNGAPINGRLLLIADQGYGDVIMFGRLVVWAQARCTALTIACSPEIMGIAAQLAPGAEIATRWEDCTQYDAFCPFSGLPRLAGTGLEQLAGTSPYLRADPVRVAFWAARLEAGLPAATRRIALSWAGRPTHNNDRNRSLALSQLAPLAQCPGMSFVSLQKGPASAQCKAWPGPAPLLDLDAEIASFEDSAAILQSVDLLISVDTSVVHLAGALGRPAWVLLPYAPDWRWLLERTDSPWYPSLRLFRQPKPGDWGSVIATVAASL